MKKAREELLRYYVSGQHAFVACDVDREMKLILNELETGLLGQISTSLDCAGLSTLYEFSESLTKSTNEILEKIGESTLSRIEHPGTCLQVLNDRLASKQSQGYLLISNVDDVISNQASFEIEAPLREVMQFRSDLAVMMAGSRETIIAMGQYDRPFYLSFRIFWFDESP